MKTQHIPIRLLLIVIFNIFLYCHASAGEYIHAYHLGGSDFGAHPTYVNAAMRSFKIGISHYYDANTPPLQVIDFLINGYSNFFEPYQTGKIKMSNGDTEDYYFYDIPLDDQIWLDKQNELMIVTLNQYGEYEFTATYFIPTFDYNFEGGEIYLADNYTDNYVVLKSEEPQGRYGGDPFYPGYSDPSQSPNYEGKISNIRWELKLSGQNTWAVIPGNNSLEYVYNKETSTYINPTFRRVITRNGIDYYSNEITISSVITEERNGIREVTYITENKTVINTTYYDGLGRPIQKNTNYTNVCSVVTPIVYDAAGREGKLYMPFSIPDHISYVANFDFLHNDYYKTKFGQNHYAFSEFKYSNTPEDQLAEQSSPGEVLRMGGGHTVKTNTTKYYGNDIKKYTLEGSSVTLSGRYPSNDLIEKVTTNAEGVTYSEYYDSQNNLVCKSMAGVKTYYVYDDLNRQRYIISPQQDSEFTTGTKTLDQLSGLCYYTEYNEFNKPYKQYVPGAGYTIYLYDKRGRLVFSQDSKMRISPEKWSFIKYDEQDRPIITGVCGGTEASHKAGLNSQTSFGEVRGSAIHGYTNNIYPVIASAEDCLTITYYDDYTWLGISELQFSDSDAFGVAKSDRIKGRISGMKNKILGKNVSGWITSVTYYDKKYNAIQTIKQLYPSGVEIASNLHNYMGDVTQLRVKQTVGGVVNEYTKIFEYDNFGRLSTVKQKVTGDNVNNTVTLASYTYDDLGRVSQKNIHNNVDPTTYTYDVAGRLIGVNSSNFSYELGFEDIGPELSGKVTPQYSGNISYIKWGNSNDLTNLYSYTYDQLNQLKSALLLKKSGTTWNANSGFAEKNINYDLNGNITSLTRSNSTGAETVLSYAYAGNKISQINGGKYAYDEAGNMTTDGLKGITIDYNLLNLAQSISVGNVEKVAYIYTSAGEKLATNVGGSLTYYRGPFVYSGNELSYIIHPEGLIRKQSGSYVYYYTKTDHLGSTRLLCHASGNKMVTDQSTDYYPYGLAHRHENLHLNRYLYNGKELQDQAIGDKILGLYDFGSRMYDPVVGRWITTDPKVEFVSPYNYCANNPLLYRDPYGQDIVLYFENDVSITVTTNLVNVHITVPKWTGFSDKIKTSVTVDGDGVLLAALDLVGIIDPSGVADMLSASIYASQNDLINAAISGIGIIPYLGDFAKTFRISKQFDILSKAVKRFNPVGASGLANPFKGKTFKQIDNMFRTKGFKVKGENPLIGEGAYFNPATGTKYYLDQGGVFKKGTEGPHVDVFYSSPGHPQYEKAKFFLDGSSKQYKPIKK